MSNPYLLSGCTRLRSPRGQVCFHGRANHSAPLSLWRQLANGRAAFGSRCRGLMFRGNLLSVHCLRVSEKDRKIFPTHRTLQ